MTPEQLTELQAITTELEALTARMRAEYEKRGVPSYVPLVATPQDKDLMALAHDMEAHQAREAAFWESLKTE